MSHAKLSQLIDASNKGGIHALRELLVFLRKNHIRRPDICLKYGRQLLQFERSLGDELWVIYEQMSIAGMDTGNIAAAEEHLRKLQGKFPGSQRVKLLEGMLTEARGDFVNAGKLYKKMVKDNPSNQLVRKRQVALLIAQGDVSEAVEVLNDYLADFSADPEAWLQLAKLHINTLNYEAAAFCYEELVLVNPSDHLGHCRLAEVYYTMGGVDNLMRARKHFSQSVDLLKAGNARALHGLCQACASLASHKPASRILKVEKEKKINDALHLFAATELRSAYARAGNSSMTSLVDDVLGKQSAVMSDA